MGKQRFHLAGLCLLLSAPLSYAKEIDEVVTVVGSKTERTLSEVAATISVISAERIEKELARDIADLVRFEPGVSVAGTGSRFGLSGFNIRGIGGNRVLTIVDGVRVPEEFSFGPFLSAQRDFVDVDSIRTVEIARGPSSSLYGSDALGGVVAFTTKAAKDYLVEEKPFHLGLKTGYSSADASAVGTLTAAMGIEKLSGLFLYTARKGDENKTRGGVGGFGSAREDADPQSTDSDNFVAKVQYQIGESHTVVIGLDHLESKTVTNIYSDYATLSRGTSVNTRDADDEKTRQRYSLNYAYEGGFVLFDRATVILYAQESETIQVTTESRTPPGRASLLRSRESFFNQDIFGLTAQMDKKVRFVGSDHQLILGIDYYETENESLRNGRTKDAATGAPVFEFFPLPTRDFPQTKVKQLAFFVQDEIELLSGRLLISPGLRYDQFDADTSADPIFLSGNPGSPVPVDFDDSEMTAKVGLVYQINNTASAFVRYSEGFRAPPYDDVNVGFTNFIGGYKTVSNENLVSETSNGWEAGVRFEGSFGFVAFSAYTNDYDDFIESLSISPQFVDSFGIDPTDGLLTFQSINVDEVKIKGAELSAEIELGSSVTRLDGFSLRTAVAFADGENKTTGEPLNSIDPLTAIFGFGYDAPSELWGAEFVWTLVEGKRDSDIDINNPRIETSGYGILDVIGYYRFNEKVALNLGVFNLTDKKHLRWADTAAIGNDAPGRFTQPGVNASVTMKIEI